MGYRYYKGPDGSMQMVSEDDYKDLLDLQGLKSNTSSISTNTGSFLDGSFSSNPSTTSGMMGGLGNYLSGQSLGDITGAVGAGIGTYDSLFGTGSKIRKTELAGLEEQLGMLKEKRAANQEALANRRQFNQTWANASNGLASSFAAPRVG